MQCSSRVADGSGPFCGFRGVVHSARGITRCCAAIPWEVTGGTGGWGLLLAPIVRPSIQEMQKGRIQREPRSSWLRVFGSSLQSFCASEETCVRGTATPLIAAATSLFLGTQAVWFLLQVSIRFLYGYTDCSSHCENPDGPNHILKSEESRLRWSPEGGRIA